MQFNSVQSGSFLTGAKSVTDNATEIYNTAIQTGFNADQVIKQSNANDAVKQMATARRQASMAKSAITSSANTKIDDIKRKLPGELKDIWRPAVRMEGINRMAGSVAAGKYIMDESKLQQKELAERKAARDEYRKALKQHNEGRNARDSKEFELLELKIKDLQQQLGMSGSSQSPDVKPTDSSSNTNLNAKDKHVVVIGGGDTAMDCVRTAIRQNAKEVTCLYRRNKENMPGSAREVLNAEQEGVKFNWLSVPSKLITENKFASSLSYKIATLGEADETGRRKPIDTGIEKQIKSDLIIQALGFEPDDLNSQFKTNLELTSWNTLKVDFKKFQTSNPKIFAAGDIVRGASLVVWAIHDGREVAKSIHQYLQNLQIKKAS